MNIELKYKQALQENGLKESDLSEDAKIGVDVITNSIKAANMLEKRGKKVGDKAIKKIKTMDKWVYYEILDQISGTEKNEEEMPYDEEEIIEDIKDDAKKIEEEEDEEHEEMEKPKVDNSKGMIIEKELQKLFESNKKEWKFEEIKSSARNTYDVLFDSYEEDEDNGIETSNYSLIETDKEIFTISKK